MVTPPGPLRPYDPPPEFQPGPPQLTSVDPWIQARRRANLDAGARPRLSSGTKTALIILIIVAVVGSCAGGVWLLFGRHLGVSDAIRQGSDGRALYVQIVGVGHEAIVQVILAEGVTDDEAVELVCGVVIPELRRAGVSGWQIQVVSVGSISTMTIVDDSACASVTWAAGSLAPLR